MLPEEDVLRVYRETIRPLYAYVSRRVGGDRGLAVTATDGKRAHMAFDNFIVRNLK